AGMLLAGALLFAAGFFARSCLWQRFALALGFDLYTGNAGFKIKQLQLQVRELLAVLAILLNALQTKLLLKLLNLHLVDGDRLLVSRVLLLQLRNHSGDPGIAAMVAQLK